MKKELPNSAKVVVIGGGVTGCSTAYHLAKFGWKDTILLERDQLTSGTTWHAAGLVSQLGPSAGVTGGTVVILGGGVVGENAAVIATGMQAKVHIVDKSEARLKQLVEMFGDKIIPEQSDKTDLDKLVAEADLLVGGVLIPGAEAPKLITKEMIKTMKRGSVIVDVAIDKAPLSFNPLEKLISFTSFL